MSQPSSSLFVTNSFQQSQPKPLFGQPAMPQQERSSLFQQAPAPVIQQTSKFYTPINELTQEEIEAFQSDMFDINKIPKNPPPIELCT